ncbi:MAG: hypothetical protein ABUL71_04965 [Gemmatimonadota bacterium]
MRRQNPLREAGLIALLVALSATSSSAQSTGTPIFQAPYRAFRTSELSLSISDPGAGTAFEGGWRTGLSRETDIGLRVGIHSRPSRFGNDNLLLGADLRSRLLTHSESFPLDGSLTLGLGFESGNDVTVGRVPVGFAMGRRVRTEGGGVSLVPYLQPVLTLLFGDASGTEFSLGFGLDARVTPRLDLRFSVGVGDRSGIGFTAAYLH